MNTMNRRYQTPLRPDFAHFLIEEQGLSDRQKKVVYQLRSKTQDPQQLLNELMASGKFTQAQLDQAKRMAEQFKGFLK